MNRKDADTFVLVSSGEELKRIGRLLVGRNACGSALRATGEAAFPRVLQHPVRRNRKRSVLLPRKKSPCVCAYRYGLSPGEMPDEQFLKPLGLTKYRLAKAIGMPLQHIGDSNLQ